MSERENPAQKAHDFFDALWKRGDPWSFATSSFERERFARLLAMISDRRYPRVLEIGCGAGSFTRLLAGVADSVLAFDISPTAIERAAEIGAGPGVEFRVANAMDYGLYHKGPWDLIVLSETIYYLGWLYSFFEVGWLASQLFLATAPGGRLFLANTFGDFDDELLLPWLIRTYHDLFRNVGYEAAREEIFRGGESRPELAVLMTLFTRTPVAGGTA
jgi:SAM-dependent methyltransferase